MEEVLKLIGTNRKTMHDWSKQYANHSTKKKFKYRVLVSAQLLFELTILEIEDLANKAGLSLSCTTGANKEADFSKKRLLYDNLKHKLIDEPNQVRRGFIEHLNECIVLFGKKLVDICYDASISESMFRHMRNGKHLEKEAVIALLIALEQGLDQIQIILKKAGSVLSCSIPSDVVVMWWLEHETCFSSGATLLLKINGTLEELDLPLLMTRPRE